MPTDHYHSEDDSDISPVSIPVDGFKSRIPAYLLEGKSESEQFILNEVSRMGHFIEWAAPILQSSNLEARRTNGKVKALWAFKELVMSWKGAIVGVFALVAAISGGVEIWNFITHFLK